MKQDPIGQNGSIIQTESWCINWLGAAEDTDVWRRPLGCSFILSARVCKARLGYPPWEGGPERSTDRPLPPLPPPPPKMTHTTGSGGTDLTSLSLSLPKSFDTQHIQQEQDLFQQATLSLISFVGTQDLGGKWGGGEGEEEAWQLGPASLMGSVWEEIGKWGDGVRRRWQPCSHLSLSLRPPIVPGHPLTGATEGGGGWKRSLCPASFNSTINRTQRGPRVCRAQSKILSMCLMHRGFFYWRYSPMKIFRA